ncbi:MAG: HDIG domain-containing protein [Candidatus Omnitrophica bacterium]|nr:HDIG domain-containing protein [Candidatus Omnitrophota bacterium]
MKISTVKKKSKFKIILSVAGFFIFLSFIFSIYTIDLSPLVLLAILGIYLRDFYKSKDLPSFFDLGILVVLGILILVLTKESFALSIYSFPAIGYIILITILFNDLQLSLLFSLFISILASGSIRDEMSFPVMVSLLSASFVSAILSYRVRTRFKIIKAGLMGGVVQFSVAVIGSNVGGSKFSLFSWELLRICMLNGVLSAIVVLGLLPVFEVVFKVLTNISLLELMDFNHPLLKRMLLEAPGTYQHSLVVANLGETSAESIGANALLVRVGAYYHDVGKIPKAQYFVENQIPYRDIHKSLKPSMSKLIIINHVKEGVELAKKYHLNPKIIDFIVQHHGRSLVYYFYQRAKELEPESGCEEEYRYPGPRPQSKEVAIVSIADTIEALSRTLDEPTPSRIRDLVKDVVRKKIMEGELDESDLTLKDLEKITDSFIRMLNAIFHTRINYPQDNGDKESTKPQENKSK